MLLRVSNLRLIIIIYSVIATIQNPVQFNFIFKLVIITLNETTPQKQHYFHLLSSICRVCCRKTAYNKKNQEACFSNIISIVILNVYNFLFQLVKILHNYINSLFGFLHFLWRGKATKIGTDIKYWRKSLTKASHYNSLNYNWSGMFVIFVYKDRHRVSEDQLVYILAKNKQYLYNK